MFTAPQNEVPLYIKLIYAVPRFTIRAAFLVQSLWVLLHYEEIGTHLGTMAFFIAIGRAFDIITDPIMGYWSDVTKTPYGRRKPFLAIGMVMYNICYILHLNPEIALAASEGAQDCLADTSEQSDERSWNLAAWFGITYTCFFFMDTFTSVPYYALGFELTYQQDTRTSIFFFQNLAAMLGTLVGLAMPVGISSVLGGTLSEALTATSLLFCVVHFTGCLGILLTIKEKGDDIPTIPFVVLVQRVFANQPFRITAYSWFFDWASVGIIGAMMPPFAKFVLAPPDGSSVNPDANYWLGIGIILSFAVAPLTMPIWLKLGDKVGKRNAWMAYNIWNCITNPLMMIVGKGDYYTWAFLCMVNGTAFGGQFWVDAVQADVIDYDEFLWGFRVDGSFAVLVSLVPKLVMAVTTALPYSILYAVGFVSTKCVMGEDGKGLMASQPQPQIVQDTIRYLAWIIPSVFTAIGCVIKSYYPIKDTATMDMIREGIELHKAGKPAYDPITKKEVNILQLSDANNKCLDHLRHFSDKTIGRFSGNKRPDLVPSQLMEFVVVLVLMCGAIATASGTFPWLHGEGNRSRSVVPTAAVMIFGLVFTLVIGSGFRLRTAFALRRSTLPDSLAQQYLGRVSSSGAPSYAEPADEEIETAVESRNPLSTQAK